MSLLIKDMKITEPCTLTVREKDGKFYVAIMSSSSGVKDCKCEIVEVDNENYSQ
jgi:hypothetical protein